MHVNINGGYATSDAAKEIVTEAPKFQTWGKGDYR